MRGVTGQQDTTMAVGHRLPRHVGEPGDPVGAAQLEVCPVHGDECLAKVVNSGIARVADLSFREHNPRRLPVCGPTDCMLTAVAVATEAELRLLVRLDFGDHPAGRGIQPGELDAGCLADQAPSSVAADEVLRSKRPAVGQLDVDAGVVLSEAHHFALAKDRNPELNDPVRQNGLEEALKERKYVVVAGGEIAHAQRHEGEPCTLHHLPRREEPFCDAPLIEHLDGAGVKPAGTRSIDVLIGASFDDDDVDPRQRQLARQHQPGRPSSRDHYRVLCYRHAVVGGISHSLLPAFRRFWPRSAHATRALSARRWPLRQAPSVELCC